MSVKITSSDAARLSWLAVSIDNGHSVNSSLFDQLTPPAKAIADDMLGERNTDLAQAYMRWAEVDRKEEAKNPMFKR